MRINHNIMAINNYRQLTNNSNQASKSLEKLSSGQSINRAGDNAALRTQTRKTFKNFDSRAGKRSLKTGRSSCAKRFLRQLSECAHTI